jgi:hypothetical protein
VHDSIKSEAHGGVNTIGIIRKVTRIGNGAERRSALKKVRDVQVVNFFYRVTDIIPQDVRNLTIKGGIIAKQGADIVLTLKIDDQITFPGQFAIGEDVLQNSDFSQESPAVGTISGLRPYRRPTFLAFVAHEGIISELHVLIK